MKYLLCLLFLLISSATLRAGDKLRFIARDKQGDTSEYYFQRQAIIKKMKRKKLVNDDGRFCFRYWDNRRLVEINMLPDSSFTGTQTQYVTKLNGNRRKLMTKTDTIDEWTACRIFKLQRQIINIPSSEKVQGWSDHCGGRIVSSVEYSDSGYYYFKDYSFSCHSRRPLQVSIMEVFVDQLDLLTHPNEAFSRLWAELPPGYYSYGGEFPMRILSSREKQRLNDGLPDNAHLEAIEEQLDSLIAKALNDAMKGDERFDFPEMMYLRFSKNNKLTKIGTFNPVKDKEDRKAFAYCKQKIHSALQNLNFDFVNTAYGFRRKLKIYEGEVKISSIFVPF